MNAIKREAFTAHCRQHRRFDSLCHLCGIAVIEKLCDMIYEMEKKHGKSRG